MKNIFFIIFGASSEIVAPIFESFKDSKFICLINNNHPDYLKGKILKTNSKNFLSQLGDEISLIDENNLIVYLNAAIFQKDDLFISLEENNIEKMLDVGINLNLAILKKVVPEMVKRKKGRLINISSFRAKAPSKGTSIYSAIKSFSETFFNVIGLEYGRFNITSNSIALGFAESKLLSNFDDEKIRKFTQNISKRKLLPADDFLLTLKFLIESEYTNSSIIDLNGGLSFLE